MKLYGTEAIAKELGCSAITIVRTIKKYPDFPKVKLKGMTSWEFDVEECKAWWKQHKNGGIERSARRDISSCGINQNDLAKGLGISLRLVLVWRGNGLPFEKLKDGSVWIDIIQAKEWFQQRNDNRTKKYAEELTKI